MDEEDNNMFILNNERENLRKEKHKTSKITLKNFMKFSPKKKTPDLFKSIQKDTSNCNL